MTDAGSFAVAADHPVLPGHFPGDPVVPGVLLLDEAARLILAAHGGRLAGLPQVKFLRPVRPRETVRVAYRPAPDRIAFTCHVDADLAVRGTLLLGPVP